MISFEYSELRKLLYQLLKQDYVALVGQHDCDSEKVYSTVFQKAPLSERMSFLPVSLPQGVVDRQIFFNILIQNLIDASRHIPSKTNLNQDASNIVFEGTKGQEAYFLRKILNLFGEKVKADQLVIVFQDLAAVEEEPLRALLLLLREYHRQIGNPGQNGSKLRFLMIGGYRLWTLCENKPSRIESPFNIAKPIFIDGISPLEIKPFCDTQSIEEATLIHYLTDGVASLTEIACQDSIVELDDLSTYFAVLEKYWNSLSDTCQEALKSLSKLNFSYFPTVRHSFRCPRIPVEFRSQSFLADNLKYIFWSGFLKIRYGKVFFRSPIHKAFSLFQARAMEDDVSTTTLLRDSLLPELKLFESSSSSINSKNDFQDAFSSLLHSSILSGNYFLIQLFEALSQGSMMSEVEEKLSLIVNEPSNESCRRFAELPRNSFKELKRHIIKTSASVIYSDIDNNYFLTIPSFNTPPDSEPSVRNSSDRNFMDLEGQSNIEDDKNVDFKNAMNPDNFLAQEEVAPLILSLIKFSSKDAEASERNDTLVAAGVDESFINNLKLSTSTNSFASSLVAQCRTYRISNNQLSKHPLISLLQHLRSLAPIYNFSDEDLLLFNNLIERGQENFKALRCRSVVGRIESPQLII
jgi:hypothetical protein